MRLTFLLFLPIACIVAKYDPNWKSLDSRPNPKWYDDAKFGIFMHWGLYSVPSFASEWFWWYWKGSKRQDVVDFMKNNFKPTFTYADFGADFTAEFFNATEFASIIKRSGAKYFVLTSKHHEGFTMWPSNYSWNWNSYDVGPKRDIVGELRNAIVSEHGVHFGLYYSLFEWFHPLFLKDRDNRFLTEEYVQTVSLPQMYELVNNYNPDVFWSDGDPGPDTYFRSPEFVAWLFNDSPVKESVLVNDRWGNGISGKHGSFFTMGDRFNPGKLLSHKWECCLTVDTQSWGYRRNMEEKDVLTIEQLITALVKAISCNGNLLLNIGPTHDGRIVPIFEERLLQMGQWLKINGEAVYDSKPWIYQNDTINPDVWYTSKVRDNSYFDPEQVFNPQISNSTIVYAFLLKWPQNGIVNLGAPKPTPNTTLKMLGKAGKLPFEYDQGMLSINLNHIMYEELPSYWAWVIKMEYLQAEDRNPLNEEFEGFEIFP